MAMMKRFLTLSIFLVHLITVAQGAAPHNDTLGIKNGYLSFETKDFYVQLVKDAQVLASLVPKSAAPFDFAPFDFLPRRAADGNYHTGDLIVRWRGSRDSKWLEQNTAWTRKAVAALNPPDKATFAAANLGPTFNASIPFSLTRTWSRTDAGDLSMSFSIKNTQNSALEIGSVGFPAEFNSIFTGLAAEDIQANCSLTDPNIGLNGGYLRVTRVNGSPPALVVTPLNDDSKFEGWDFLTENGSVGVQSGYQTSDFEGLYQWMVHTRAYAEQEWNATIPWNTPTSRTLKPGEAFTVGLVFKMASQIDQIEDTLRKTGSPVAVGIPGYIIPQDMEAQLLIDATAAISSISTKPKGAFKTQLRSGKALSLTPSPTAFGRVRLNIKYSDGKEQSIHYHISKSAPQAVQDVGTYLSSKHWWTNESDPFGRAPSFMAVDHSGGIGQKILQLDRVWLAGECHEAGASWLTAAMKQVAQPVAEEVAKLETFIHKVLWKTIQLRDSYAVRQSIFWYDPTRKDFWYDPRLPYELQTQTHYSNSWNAATANVTTRGYGYIFPAATYWALYRAGRAFPEMLKEAPWQWYLNQSYQTVKYAFGVLPNGTHPVDYWNLGLMGETIIGELLKDLQREDWTSQADEVISLMKARSDVWEVTAVPFGSELHWDSTGQEGVFYWSNYFGREATVNKTIGTIMGYTPTVNHWGYNGNARRYWDFQFDGKISRIERQIHHYGSALNSLPLLGYFRSKTMPLYVLRITFGGVFAPLSNIQDDGFGSTAFHSWADTLAWEVYSGDYGPAFLGMMLGSATYVVDDGELSLTAFGGQLVQGSGKRYTVMPFDALRKRIYFQAEGLYVELDYGAVQSAEVSSKQLKLKLVQRPTPAATAAGEAILWVERTTATSMSVSSVNVSGKALIMKRGGWAIPLGAGTASVTLTLK
ncbi:hypothetical protein NA57DRAFT_73745 [Rhizodiscina lignyota]|uniref:Uncharacterized protein n=1 Tax=Rhizodiscina lignyota TaxID=1504668 RepID=A0A9P4IN72_9PEZI|nr:hypothetical protein NA57DRAFT_73745 [Rhizodiscina lignyota]